jgi:hypothetical protein
LTGALCRASGLPWRFFKDQPDNHPLAIEHAPIAASLP